jgi:hypothetical protein
VNGFRLVELKNATEASRQIGVWGVGS